jgi:hypothetical protein
MSNNFFNVDNYGMQMDTRNKELCTTFANDSTKEAALSDISDILENPHRCYWKDTINDFLPDGFYCFSFPANNQKETVYVILDIEEDTEHAISDGWDNGVISDETVDFTYYELGTISQVKRWVSEGMYAMPQKSR